MSVDEWELKQNLTSLENVVMDSPNRENFDGVGGGGGGKQFLTVLIPFSCKIPPKIEKKKNGLCIIHRICYFVIIRSMSWQSLN